MRFISLLLLLFSFTLVNAQECSFISCEFCSANKIKFYKETISNRNSNMDNYDIKYHRFEWFVNPEKDTISGVVTTYFQTTNNVDTIFFNLTDKLSADSVIINNEKQNIFRQNNQIGISKIDLSSFQSFDSVKIYYHGNPVVEGQRSFSLGSHDSVASLWTLSEPYGSSDWFPTKNNLTDKIDSVDIFVSLPAEYNCASIGILQWDTINADNNIRTVFWKHRYPITPYLIGIAATNYVVYDHYFKINESDSVLIQNYVYPEDSTIQRNETLKMVETFDLFNNLFGVYPFYQEKYGHAQCEFTGGMEHQTMTFMGGIFTHHVLSHELAHHWFGNMITCSSWQDIWLNEGFATYCTALTYEKLFNGIWFNHWKEQTLNQITQLPDGSVFCNDTTSVERIFDSRLSYAKGAYILHQLRWVIGDSTFFEGINSYLNDTNIVWKYASTEDLIYNLEKVYNKDLDWYFDDWFMGEGYPSYKVTLNSISENEYKINLFQTQSHNSVEFFELPIPIRFYGNNTDTTIVFDNQFNNQNFFFNIDFKIDSIKIDPDKNIISANNTIELQLSKVTDYKYFKVYPNPLKNEFYIESDNISNFSFSIFDNQGKKVKFILDRINDNKVKISTKNTSKGIYYLRIFNKYSDNYQKIIIN